MSTLFSGFVHLAWRIFVGSVYDYIWLRQSQMWPTHHERCPRIALESLRNHHSVFVGGGACAVVCAGGGAFYPWFLTWLLFVACCWCRYCLILNLSAIGWPSNLHFFYGGIGSGFFVRIPCQARACKGATAASAKITLAHVSSCWLSPLSLGRQFDLSNVANMCLADVIFL